MLSSVLLASGSTGGGTGVSWLQTAVAAVLGGLLVAASNIFTARSSRKSAKEADERRAASDLALAKENAASNLALAQAGADRQSAADVERLQLGHISEFMNALHALWLVALQGKRPAFKGGDDIRSSPEEELNLAWLHIQLTCPQVIVEAGSTWMNRRTEYITMSLGADASRIMTREIERYHTARRAFIDVVRAHFGYEALPAYSYNNAASTPTAHGSPTPTSHS